MLQWCLELGISEVTVFAFSVDNFQRSSTEVDSLMDLSRRVFTKILRDGDILQGNNVCVRVQGDLSLLPVDLRELINNAVEVSRKNSGCVFACDRLAPPPRVVVLDPV